MRVHATTQQMADIGIGSLPAVPRWALESVKK